MAQHRNDDGRDCLRRYCTHHLQDSRFLGNCLLLVSYILWFSPLSGGLTLLDPETFRTMDSPRNVWPLLALSETLI